MTRNDEGPSPAACRSTGEGGYPRVPVGRAVIGTGRIVCFGTPARRLEAVPSTRVSRMKKFHLNAGNSGVQLLRSTYSGTLQYTHSKFANRTAAVTRNTQRTPKAAATAPPESGPIELPRNIAEAVMP